MRTFLCWLIKLAFYILCGKAISSRFGRRVRIAIWRESRAERRLLRRKSECASGQVQCPREMESVCVLINAISFLPQSVSRRRSGSASPPSLFSPAVSVARSRIISSRARRYVASVARHLHSGVVGRLSGRPAAGRCLTQGQVPAFSTGKQHGSEFYNYMCIIFCQFFLYVYYFYIEMSYSI